MRKKKISKERIIIIRKATLYYTKCVLKIIIVTMVFISIVFATKYKPMYRVTIAGEDLGYVTSKGKIEKYIKDYTNTNEGCIAYIDVPNTPEYTFSLVPWNREDSTQKVLDKVKESSVITYKVYEIKVGNEAPQYVSTRNEAEKVVEEIKKEFEGMIDLNITVQSIYTQDINDIKSIDVQVAKANLDNEIEISNNAINGIILSNPTKGTVSSRYGTRWGRQHTGIDVAAATGTPIKSCSKGVVKFTGVYGGYGNLVIINHGNGVETYYAHCSKIYVSVGDEVTKDTVIASMGSTGNSTGPHLHLEIRKNGVVQNPQNYVYN